MEKKLIVLVCLAGVVTVTESLAAEVITLGASKDATIYQSHVNNSNGAGQGMFAGMASGGFASRGLIAFDVSGAIPPGSTINSVQLTLFLAMVAGGGMGGGGGVQTIGLHRLFADWGEGTTGSTAIGPGGTGAGFAAGAGDATWNARFYSPTTPILWIGPGGDYAESASGSTIVAATINQGYSWSSTVELVADVQDWLDTPSTNFGWLVRNENESGSQTFRAFWTREESRTDPAAQFVPRLEITYIPSASLYRPVEKRPRPPRRGRAGHCARPDGRRQRHDRAECRTAQRRPSADPG